LSGEELHTQYSFVIDNTGWLATQPSWDTSLSETGVSDDPVVVQIVSEDDYSSDDMYDHAFTMLMGIFVVFLFIMLCTCILCITAKK